MTDFTSSSSRRKVPPLDPEDFASWEMLFKNYCGYEEWDLFYEYAPEIDEDELDRLRTPEGDDTEESDEEETDVNVSGEATATLSPKKKSPPIIASKVIWHFASSMVYCGETKKASGSTIAMFL